MLSWHSVTVKSIDARINSWLALLPLLISRRSCHLDQLVVTSRRSGRHGASLHLAALLRVDLVTKEGIEVGMLFLGSLWFEIITVKLFNQRLSSSTTSSQQALLEVRRIVGICLKLADLAALVLWSGEDFISTSDRSRANFLSARTDSNRCCRLARLNVIDASLSNTLLVLQVLLAAGTAVSPVLIEPSKIVLSEAGASGSAVGSSSLLTSTMIDDRVRLEVD